MSDLVVTVPKKFGLDRWIEEGDAAGEPWSGQLWSFTVGGPRPPIEIGDRVYIVCNGKLRGYSPLVQLHWSNKSVGMRPPNFGPWELVRGGDAVAVTIPEKIVGFMGWRKRWWERTVEVPFPDWRTP